jgi:hypothetical protein
MREVTPIVDDQEMLRAYAETIKLKDAEIERLKGEIRKLETLWFSENYRMKDLLTRAADRIYMWVDAGLDPSLETKELIAELRKAAQ